jgi:hypothetical protein
MHPLPPYLAPPPRHVPLSLRILNFCNGMALVAWLVTGLGSIFLWTFGLNADVSFLTFRGPYANVTGRVTAVEETNASENKRRVYANHYEYSVAGKQWSGRSYSTGGSANVSEEVTVEYAPADPSQSRIAGMRRKLFGPGPLFVVIVPLVGLVILSFAIRLGIHRNRMLRDGLLTTGRLQSKEPTNVRINKQPVYKLTFAFTARDGRRGEAVARTHQPQRLMDEAEEPLLYDPANPAEAFVLDEVPSRPQFEANGDLRRRPAAAIGALMIPLLIIAANAAVILVMTGIVKLW